MELLTVGNFTRKRFWYTHRSCCLFVIDREPVLQLIGVHPRVHQKRHHRKPRVVIPLLEFARPIVSLDEPTLTLD